MNYTLVMTDYNTIINLLGKRIDDLEIKDLFKNWNCPYPKKLTCTPNHSILKTKLENSGLRIGFSMGGYSQFMVPQKHKFNSYISLMNMIEFTDQYSQELPFGVNFMMSEVELTSLLGEPKKDNIVFASATWKKPIDDRYELVVSDTIVNNKNTRVMFLSFIFDPNY
jgi:hypothetical protein